MKQPSLFDTDDIGLDAYGKRRIEPTDPHLTPAEKPRLSRQCREILERLRQGPATNSELASIALKYTGRCSDLRAAGCIIDIASRDHQTGLVTYVLTYAPENL